MARPLRIEYPHALYHITARGNERKHIFLDKKDYNKFLFYLGIVQERYKIVVYAYVLMGNHYHLLIETLKPNLSRMMRDLNGHYTIYFNRRHRRYGHLFQGRYKAILVDKGSYLLELSRYIHLNPVRAGISSKPEDYTYSSMPAYIAKTAVPSWLDIDFTLSQFGEGFHEQRKAYKEFVCEEKGKPTQPLNKLYAHSILGSKDFVKKIIDEFLSKKDIPKQIPASKKLTYGKDLKDVAGIVKEYYSIDRETFLRKKAKFNNARKAFVYLARKYTEASLKHTREFLGKSITESAVSKLFNRTQEELIKNKNFQKDMKKIEDRLFGVVNMSQVKT